MAKQAKTAIKTSLSQAAATKNWTKVIRAIKNNKTGNYTFSENMVNKDKIQEHLKSNKK